MKNTRGGMVLKKSKGSSVRGSSAKKPAFVSLIFFLLDSFSSIVYNGLKGSFFGSIITAYNREQRAFDNSYIKAHFSEGILVKKYFRIIRRFLSKSFENSIILRIISRISLSLVTIPLRTLGSAVFSFGIYVAIIYTLRLFLPVISTVDASYAIIGIIACASAIPMLLSRDNIASAVGKSVILGTVFRELFGFREESFKQRTNMRKFVGNAIILFGMLLGILTLIVHPLVIVSVIAAIVLVAIIFTSPEIGIIVALFSIPFLSFFEYSAMVLGFLVMLISLSFIVKLIKGKRILRFELIDFAVLFFGIIIFFSGTISAGGIEGIKEVLITCELMLGYFLIVNLIRTETWIKRCIGTLVTSGTVVAIIGVVQYLAGAVSNKAWLDTDYFYDIKGRVVSVFDNPNILSIFLVMILPFSLYMLLKAYTGRAKLLGLISVVSIILCTVLTWSRGAWIAAIASVVVFLLMYSKKTLRYILLGVFFVPFGSFFLPNAVVRRFASIGDIADSSTMYRVYTWKGSLRMLGDYFFSGIGYGMNAYQEIYPQYAYAGIESAEHSHSLFLQIIIGTGIIGLIAFAIVLFLFTQMNLEYIKDTKDTSGRLIVIAALCSVMASLVFGLFDYTWYNYRIFFIFWTVIAIACACVRIGREEERRRLGNTASKLYDLSSLDIKE